jgi:methylglutaconyl-CoA hydratase
LVLEEKNDSILVVKLNEPERANPLSPTMATALTRALVSAAEDEGVRAVVLAGAGRHFSAGADLAALEQVAQGGSREANLADSRVLETLFATVLDHPKLTVAAVEGAAIAGGCGLATACDLVVAGRNSKFAYSEVKIGFVPALVSTFLTRRVAPQVARRLLLTGQRVSAEEAARIDLVDEVVDAGQALIRAEELAREICVQSSPSAVEATKKLLNIVVGCDWRSALKRAAETNAEQRLHPECRRGVRTFLETKTTPDWLGEE